MQNYRSSIASLTDEQRLQGNYRRSISFKSVQQKWNYENPCTFCGCIHLTCATALQKKLCCQSGDYLTNPNYPKLFELPLFLKNLMLLRTEHLSTKSSYYNNMFSIAVTGYDNGRKGVGCEQINGPSALKINGRVYHFFPPSANQKFGGISNFTYDGAYQLEGHANLLNGDEQGNPRVFIPFVKGKF
jgi:hypothetical protein